jgi:hypothetical protein
VPAQVVPVKVPEPVPVVLAVTVYVGAAVKVAVTVQLEAGMVPESTFPECVPPQVSLHEVKADPEPAVAVQDHAVPAVYVPAQDAPETVPVPLPAVAVDKVYVVPETV